MTEAGLFAFMAKNRLGVLATSGRNVPQSAMVGVAVTPELEIVFDTLRTSRKYGNLIARPACSLVIGGWDSADTVQYEGAAQELMVPDLERYQSAYFRVWPDGRSRLNWPGITYFVVRPSWIRYSDFGEDPPMIREFSFPRGRL